MAEKIEDLNLPNAVILRLVKEVLPDSVNLSKEARNAITKAASVFILYLTSSANAVRLREKHKIIQVQYVLEALEDIEFESFIPPLKEALESFKKTVKDKKDRKKDEMEKRDENSEALPIPDLVAETVVIPDEEEIL